MATPTPSIDLPVPYDALLELGLSPEQIEQAQASAPAVVAFQADRHPGAWFDVERAGKALRALGAFRHTKGRWAGVRMRLGEGLDPWQVVWVLAPVFGWVHHDEEIDRVVRVIRTVWVEVPRKAGKALDTATPILTARGWTTMGQVVVGDQVHAPDGTLTPVVATSNIFEDHDCYEVEFSDGQILVADAGHLWTVNDRYAGSMIVTTETMAGRFLIGSRSTHRERRYSLAVPAAIERPDVDLPIDPYVLGTWLGDGETAGARVTSGDPEVFASIEAAGYVFGAASGGGITRNVLGLREQLRLLGVLGNKYVPEAYMLASRRQRLELLRGLMDSDGTVGAGAGAAPRCEFTSTTRALADGVLFLARSLGCKATLKQGRATLRGVDCGPKYRVSWCAYADESPFRLARKTGRLAERPATPARSSTLQVVDVRKVATRATRCIQVGRPDGMYLAGGGLIPTHNSTLSSAISGVLLLADGEMGAEVYNAAGSTLQAGRVFDDAKRMLLTSPAARKRVEPLKEVIRVPRTGGILRVLSRVAETAHGLNVSGAIVDEVHTLRLRRALVEAIETGTGARDQPLIVFITTADEAEEGTIYDEKHTYCRNVALGIVNDPGHYGVIWAAADTDDPFVESTWRKANPGLGKSPTLTYMRREAEKAKASPSYYPTFCRLSLNRRMRDQSLWLDMDRWDECARLVDRAALRGRRAWGGLDLSAVSDFTAWATWVESERPGTDLELLCRFWVPGDRLEALERKLLVPIRQWVNEGWITATEGDVIDYAAVRSAIIGDCRHLSMQRISYDRMFAGPLVQELAEEVPQDALIPVAQTYLGLSPACKELERLLGAELFRQGGNPVLRWMASVVEVRTDGLDNIRPVKPDRLKSTRRIDGIQAAVTGLDGWLRMARNVKKPSRRVVVS